LASFKFLFVPDPNVNGKNRLVIEGHDPHFASTVPSVVEITVLPVNDPPYFVGFGNGTVQQNDTYAVTNGTYDDHGHIYHKWDIYSRVGDFDFFYNHVVRITFCVRVADGVNSNAANNHQPDAWFVLPLSTTAGGAPPCNLTDSDRCITCQDLIEELDGWQKAAFTLVFNDSVSGDVSVELNVNDNGNIDYRYPPPPLNTSVWLNGSLTAQALVAATKPANNNIALIAAPIAGLIAGALIAGLIFAIRKNQKAAVENYFDRFALGMEGASNSSPLYEGATKGGESPIYKGSS